MKYKPDWPEARERLSALWEGRCLDRPCVSVTAPVPKARQVPQPQPPKEPWRRWLDPDISVAAALASVANTWWGGEAIPSYLLMGGWVVSLGGRPHFDHKTIWFEPFAVDFTRPSPFVHRPEDAWVKKYEAVYLAVAEAAGYDDFLIGQPCMLPANDLLSMHMGTQDFLIALMDHPAWMRDAILAGAREQLKAREHMRQLLGGRHAFWYGSAGWMPFWAPVPYKGTQSDVSCMLSPDQFDEFVVPELDVYGKACGAMWYHLDGRDARQHLPRLLSLPYLRVLQYTPNPQEPPNGVGQLDFYREVQKAGRVVHIHAASDQVEPLVRALDPGLIMIHTWCRSVEEGQELLASVKRWMGARTPRPAAPAGGPV